MDRKALLQAIDGRLLNDLYGYCYRRCSNSVQAEDLCSEIVLAVVKAAGRQGEILSADAFIWKTAHNVYADFSYKRRMESEHIVSTGFTGGDGTEAPLVPTAQAEDMTRQLEEAEQVQCILREIAFLSKAYRDVMVLHYLEGKPISAVAKELGISRNAVRQRLFYARNTVRNEVSKMEYVNNTPLALQKLDFEIIGTGNCFWGDPRDVCCRQLSNHIVWLCRNKAASAKEISEALHVPMPYVEEELAIQCSGTNGQYGLLKQLDNGRYAINFLLLDKPELERAQAVFTDRIPLISQIVAEFVETHKEEYLSFPYLNKKVDLNLILWQQISHITHQFSGLVDDILAKEHFPDVPQSGRPFTVFGYRKTGGPEYGCGWDGIDAHNVCGYSYVQVANIYISRVPVHFHCGHNIATDPQLQLAIRAIGGLPVASLSEEEKEPAAKAIECGYLYRDGDRLYTKILVSPYKEDPFAISNGIQAPFRPEAETMAADLAKQIKAIVPEHLLGDYRYFNSLASLPVLDTLVEALIQRGLLVPPENGPGAEGCWMRVDK